MCYVNSMFTQPATFILSHVFGNAERLAGIVYRGLFFSRTQPLTAAGNDERCETEAKSIVMGRKTKRMK